MKKIFSIILIILLVSPITFADELSDRMEQRKAVEKTPEKLLEKETRELNRPAYNFSLQGAPKINDRLSNVRERMQGLKEKTRDVQKEFRDERGNIRKEVRKVCQDDKESDDCVKARDQGLSEMKELLKNTADRMIDHLENVKVRISANENISDEDKQAVIARLDLSIADLVEAKADVDAATTEQELKDAAKSIRDVWKKIKFHAFWAVAFNIDVRFEHLLRKFNHYKEILDCVLDEMQSQGKDTGIVGPLVDEYDGHVDAAVAAHAKAHDLVQEARVLDWESDAEKIRELLHQAREQLKISHQELREAYAILKDIMQAVKESGADVSACRQSAEVNA